MSHVCVTSYPPKLSGFKQQTFINSVFLGRNMGVLQWDAPGPGSSGEGCASTHMPTAASRPLPSVWASLTRWPAAPEQVRQGDWRSHPWTEPSPLTTGSKVMCVQRERIAWGTGTVGPRPLEAAQS